MKHEPVNDEFRNLFWKVSDLTTPKVSMEVWVQVKNQVDNEVENHVWELLGRRIGSQVDEDDLEDWEDEA